MKVSLVKITPEAEQHIAYCARVSSPNQTNRDIARLLKYCIRHGHWSVFEQGHMTVEIIASRNITRQILRHWSFRFQEFSQRYSDAIEFEFTPARRQATTNRQSSIDDMDQPTKDWWKFITSVHQEESERRYRLALEAGIAKEVARDLLPESAQSRIYMTGNIRDWIHYLTLRTKSDTQLEHRQVAEAIKEIFLAELPTIGEAVWPTPIAKEPSWWDKLLKPFKI